LLDEEPSVSIPSEAFFTTRDTPLSSRELGQISGIRELIGRVAVFTEKAQKIEQRIAQETGSPLFSGGLSDDKRLAAFVQRFHDGELNLPDITATFEKALQYYYANRLHPDHGRNEILALIDTTLEGGQSEQHNVDEEWE
jgi:hypothetical protein